MYNFKQIYKFEVMCQGLFMNDVINFGGTKTSLFLSYSSLEFFDSIGLERYKFPESESCLTEVIFCWVSCNWVLDMDRTRKYSRTK